MPDNIFVIAEAGVNHNGSLDLAMQLVDAAVEAKADAVKFQSFSAKRLVRRETELVPYQIGSASNHFELLRELELTEIDQRKIADYSKSKGIQFLSTPYSAHDALFLIGMGLDTIKVASADIVDLELHSLLCEKKVKVFASTGMADMDEVSRLVELYKSLGNLHNLWLMQCVSNYPSNVSNQNLRVLNSFKSLVGDRIGFSDHTDSSIAALVAVGLGATIFEKHLTLNKSMNGPDHAASLEPQDFSEYVESIRIASNSLGSESKMAQAEELEMRRISRKGIYLKRDILSGEEIGKMDVELMRPAQGVDAWEILLNLPTVSDLNYKKGDPLKNNHHD